MNNAHNGSFDDPIDLTVGDRNVERLLRSAYDPEPVAEGFAQRVRQAMHAAALERSATAAGEIYAASSAKDAAPSAWKLMLAAAIAASIIVGLFSISGPGGRREHKARPESVVLRPSDARIELLDRRPAPVVALVENFVKASTAAATANLTKLELGESLVTAAHERKRAMLPDGSIVWLNERSRIRVDGPRRLSLASGEAFFEVAPPSDGRRGDGVETSARFVVATPRRDVVALGTKFVVRVDPKQTEVIVAQGKVAVDGVEKPLFVGEKLLALDDSALAGGIAGKKIEQVGQTFEREAAPRVSAILDWAKELSATSAPALVPPSDHAGGALVVKGEDGQETRLSMRRYHVDVHIEDGFARTTIDQTYFNHLPSRQEGTFFFPLPADASISRLAMYVAGKLMEGGMAERQHAAEVFESIKRKMQDPALLEWIDGTTFRMRVFPLEGREEKRIILSYTQRLPALYGKSTYRFPAGHNLGKVGLWSAAVHVKGGASTAWRSPSHTFAPTTKDNALTLTTVAKDAGLDRDIVVELTDADAAVAKTRGGEDGDRPASAVDRSVRIARADHELSRYYMLRQRPELPRSTRRERRDWILLVETSADRDPLLARAQIEVARGVLAHVEHDDTFTILTAAASTNRLTEDMQPATVANARDAVARLEDTQLLGALDLAGSLAAVKPIAAACGNPYLVHIGGGYAALGPKEQDQLAALLPEKTKYIGIGVGKRWNRAWMKLAASRTGGYFTQINPDEDIAWRSLDLVATLNTPRLLDVKVIDDTGRAWLAFDDSIADGEEVCALVRLDAPAAAEAIGPNAKVDAAPQSVTIAGTLDGQPFRQTYPVANVADNAGYLPRMWAKLEIDRLLADNPAAHKYRITALSKAMYVMSPFTSLLVLENDEMYTQYNVDRGRKDHWAMYPSPENIPVVREPLTPAPSPPTADKPAAGLAGSASELEAKVAAVNAKTQETLASLSLQPRFLAAGFGVPALSWRYRGQDLIRNGGGAADDYYVTLGRANRRYLVESLAEQDVRLKPSPWVKNGGGSSVNSPLGFIQLQLDGTQLATIVPQTESEFLAFGGQAQGGYWNRPGVSHMFRGGVPALGLPLQVIDGRELWSEVKVRQRHFAHFDYTTPYYKTLHGDAGIEAFYFDGALVDGKRLAELSRQRTYRFAVTPQSLDLSTPLHTVESLLAANGDRFGESRFLTFGVAPQVDNLTLYEVNLAARANLSAQANLANRYDVYFAAPNLAKQRGLATFGDNANLWGVAHDFDSVAVNGWDDFGWSASDVERGRELRRLHTRATDLRQLLRRSGRAAADDGIDVLTGPVTVEYAEELGKIVIAGQPRDTETVLGLIRDLDATDLTEVDRLTRLKDRTDRKDRRAGAVAQGLGDEADANEPVLPGEKLNLVYEHPNLAALPALVNAAHSLASYAPGMYTMPADAQAVVEEEVSEHRPTLGKIDPAARKLIDGARSRGWQQVTIPLFGQPLDVLVDGAGRHRYTRYTAYGLGEQIVCDGSGEWRLYAELGLGAKRKLSRYHRAEIERLIPWLVPTAEDLALGGDVTRVDDRTVAVVRTVDWEIVKVDLDKIARDAEPAEGDAADAVDEKLNAATDAAKPSSKKARIDVARLLSDAEREKRSTRYEMRLVFVDDGRLSERQWLVDGKRLLRVTYGPSGSIVWSDAQGKNLAERTLAARPAEAPSLKPDTRSLVVLPLPWRRWGTGPTAKLKADKGLDYVNYTDDEAMTALAAFLVENDASAVQDLIARRFFASPEQVRGKATPADRRLGFYMLLCLAGCNWQPDGIVSLGGIVERKIPASPLADHPNSPIAWLLARELADRKIGHAEPPAMRSEGNVAADKAGRSLAATLVTLRRLFPVDDPATPVVETAPEHVNAHLLTHWQTANSFVQNTRSPLLAMAVLATMQRAAANSQAAWTHIAAGYERWPDHPGWSGLARYEAARAWFKSGDRRRAQDGFSSWYAELVAAGDVPVIDHDFRRALYGENKADNDPSATATENLFTRKLLDAAKSFSSRGAPRAALLIAWQAYQLEQPALADEIVNRTLAALKPEESQATTLAAIRVLYHAGKVDRADALLTPLLDDKEFGQYLSLWRLGANLAEQRGRLAASVARWEKVAELEYARLGKTYDVAAAREPFESLMQRYDKLVTALAATSQQPSPEMVAKVVRAADRWRTLDADPTAACYAAAKILVALGREDLAWAYATTPLASQPASATPNQPADPAPYATLARQLAERGEVALAARAFAAAEAAQPKSAQFLWEHAQLLEKHGRFGEARGVYERLSAGEWPAEQSELKRQAAERLSVRPPVEPTAEPAMAPPKTESKPRGE